MLPVKILAVGGQDCLRCRQASQTTVKIETGVDDPEQGCLVTSRHDCIARSHRQRALIADGPVEAPNCLVTLNIDVVEPSHMRKLRRV